MQATELAPGEPAVWANLGLAHLRLGEFDAAAPAIERAAALAPASSEIAFLDGPSRDARGRREEGIAHLRRAVELDPRKSSGAHRAHSGGRERRRAGRRRRGAAAARRAASRSSPTTLPCSSSAPVSRPSAAMRPLLQDSVKRAREVCRARGRRKSSSGIARCRRRRRRERCRRARAMAFLRNVLARVPAFRESRRAGHAVRRAHRRAVHSVFCGLPTPVATPSPADDALTFSARVVGDAPADAVGGADRVFLRRRAASGHLRRRCRARCGAWTRPARRCRFLRGTDGGPCRRRSRRARLESRLPDGSRRRRDRAACACSSRLPTGRFTDETARCVARERSDRTSTATGAWAADIEMDGDLDIVVGVRDAPPVVLRNNGDGTLAASCSRSPASTGFVAFVWGDLDGDGDPDAAVARRARGAARLRQPAGGTVRAHRAARTPSATDGCR